MRKGLIALVLVVLFCVLTSCSQQPVTTQNKGTSNQGATSQEANTQTSGKQESTKENVINMDSDYSIEKHLAGSWTWTNGTTTCTLDFKDENKTASWVIYGYTYSGNYRVSSRQITCDMHSAKTAPTLFVHELTSTSLEITGVGKVPISVGHMIFTKNN